MAKTERRCPQLNRLKTAAEKIRAGALRGFWREAAWALGYVRRYKLVVAVHILLGVASIGMGLGTSVASKYLIDAVTGRKTNAVGTAAAAMATMLLLGILLRAVSGRVGARLSIRVQNEIQAEVYQKILTTAWEPLEQFRPGDLLSRLTGDVGTVAGGVTGFAPGAIAGAAQFAGALGIMLFFDPVMAAIALVCVPASACLSRLLAGRMRGHSKQMKAISSDIMSFYEDSLSNLTSIKAFGVTGLFGEKMLRLQGEYRAEYLDYNRFSVRTSAGLSLMGAAASAGCFSWGVFRLWSGAITYGSLTMFLQLSSALGSAFSALIGMVSSAISLSTSAGRVMAITQLPDEQTGTLPDEIRPEETSVRMEGLGFAYQNGRPVLRGVAFHAGPNELVALTGPSGGGKTTLLRLLLGLARPQQGSAALCCGGRQYPLSAATRSAFAYVPQGSSLFAGTIRDNLRMARPDADEARLHAALRAACADDFVRALPGGLDYSVGARGKGLSEGQMQRLAIARAMLRGAPVLLLDEATSALDEATEAQLLHNLMSSGMVHTCVFATHRPGTAKICTRRYRVDGGTVREEL